MRRYFLNINDKDFEIDVRSISAEKYEVFVGGETYEVNLNGEERLFDESGITPGVNLRPAAAPTFRKVSREAASSVAQSGGAPLRASAPAVAPGKGALLAPMPGVILEVSVKPGEKVKRGQQVAILEAMKMRNLLGAPRDGVVAEVCVDAGQTVDHGAPIITYQEG